MLQLVLRQWKESLLDPTILVYNNVLSYIWNQISNALQLMDSLGNVDNAISVVGYWIFDSNHKKALCLTQELLDIICSPSIGEELVPTFRSVFYAVRYSWAPIHLKKG